ncbi:hypothetical protein PSAC2689_200091 [Paraburkholderia sacchari]
MSAFRKTWHTGPGSARHSLPLNSHMVDAGTMRPLDELLAYPEVPRDWKSHRGPSAAPSMPVIPTGFVSAASVLRYLSMVTTVSAP